MLDARPARVGDEQRAMSRAQVKYAAQLGVVCAAYFAAGRLGLSTPFTSGNVSPVWPASGIALAAILLCGYRIWPAITAGAFLINFFSAIPHTAAIGLATGNTLAALMGGVLLRRLSGFQNALSRLRDVLALILLGAVASTVVSASIGVVVLFATHVRPWANLGSAWLVYWAGDGMGILLVTPMILAFPQLWRIRPKIRIAELVVLILLLTTSTLIVFNVRTFSLAIFPFVVWAAIRFGIAGCALSTLVIAGIGTVETARGIGPFVQRTPFINAALLPIYIAVLSVSGLLIAALIAERDQLIAQEAAKDARLQLAALVESSDDAIIATDLEGVVSAWNKGAERLFGYSEPEIVGKNISLLYPPEHRADFSEVVQKLKSGESVRHYETVRLKKSGAPVEVSVAVSLIRDTGGKVIGVCAVDRDITERKEQEESARQTAAIIELAREAIIQRDNRGRVLKWNRGASELYGWTSVEAMGQITHKLLNTQTPSEVHDIDRLLENQGAWEGELVHTRRDGTQVIVESRQELLRDSNGDPLCVLEINRDITERKQAEEALRRSEKLAATGRLAATIAHEINNPLEALTNLFYLLEADKSLGSAARDYAQTAQEELRRIAHITKQMLAFHRQTPIPVTVDVAELLDTVVGLYATQIELKSITVSRQYEDAAVIKGYPAELRQVFANLLGNAIEAVGQRGTIRLHIFRGHEWNGSGRYGVRVVVADNGPGIPASNRTRIFDPFFTTKGERGTGIGLWVSNGIVQKHEGSIQVRTSTRQGGSGTCFSVFLPERLSARAVV